MVKNDAKKVTRLEFERSPNERKKRTFKKVARDRKRQRDKKTGQQDKRQINLNPFIINRLSEVLLTVFFIQKRRQKRATFNATMQPLYKKGCVINKGIEYILNGILWNKPGQKQA